MCHTNNKILRQSSTSTFQNENNLASVSARLEWLESRGKGRNNISNNDVQSSNLLTASQVRFKTFFKAFFSILDCYPVSSPSKCFKRYSVC